MDRHYYWNYEQAKKYINYVITQFVLMASMTNWIKELNDSHNKAHLTF